MSVIPATAKGTLGRACRLNLVARFNESPMNVADFCDKAGITPGMFSFLRHGRRVGSLTTIERMAAAFDVPPWTMFLPPAGEECSNCHGLPRPGWTCNNCKNTGLEPASLRSA